MVIFNMIKIMFCKILTAENFEKGHWLCGYSHQKVKTLASRILIVDENKLPEVIEALGYRPANHRGNFMASCRMYNLRACDYNITP